ncbi:CsbD family protein [Thalassoroseus pseudoceratinae]|uniref:CsbD family protein n=1 Tax=Thalassoroseus pseudoceratinae TaxID=2713176 RepID=UPI00142473B4|nr:CsbD family protein [Thalassoroseus pseudoceratinae]
MITSEELKGNWNQLRGKVEERWSQLSSNDLDQINGNVDQLVGVLQQKTGQAKQTIEHELNELLDSSAQNASSVAEKLGAYSKEANEYAAQVAEQARQQYMQMAGGVQEGYNQAGEYVKQHPAESVAVAFGTGLIAGVMLGLIVRR